MDFHPWKSNLELIIALPEQHYNYPRHTRQLCLHIGPMPMQALPFGLSGEATPPHPSKPLGLLAGGGGTLKSPLRTFKVSDPDGGQPSPRNFCPCPDFFKPARKQMPVPPENQKKIALAFLKAAWLQIPYWVHFTFKVSNPIYICALPPSK
jgi:hypothetical protein